MAEDKKSIIVYSDWISTFNSLDDDEAGRLIKHFFSYINDLNPIPPDKITKIAFEPIKQHLKRDLKKWELIKEKRIKAGKASALKRQQMSTHVESVEHTSTLSTVNVNGNVNVNVINTNSQLVNEMVKIFTSRNPNYSIIPNEHYPQCLQIAYRIAQLKGWDKKDVLNGKKDETLKSWETIVDFIKTDDWMSTRGLIDLNNTKEWDRLIQKMNLSKSVIKKKDIEGSSIKKESEVDFEKYRKK